jgi:hypothetical protein
MYIDIAAPRFVRRTRVFLSNDRGQARRAEEARLQPERSRAVACTGFVGRFSFVVLSAVWEIEPPAIDGFRAFAPAAALLS